MSASIARCPGPTSANLTLEWTQVWELTVRTIASPGTARAACDLAATILHSELLDYPDIADTVESMLSSVELNGPAIITDSALALWSVMIDLRFKANPAQSQDMAKQVCAWLKAVWTTGTPLNPLLVVPNHADNIHSSGYRSDAGCADSHVRPAG
jgi:ataxia telangiectasia mutated family protein